MTKLKNLKYDELVVPIYFYCTFTEDIGIHRALELKHLSFMDSRHHIDVSAARSPSDLLMLNRNVSKLRARTIAVIIAIIVFALVTASSVLFNKANQSQLYYIFRLNPPNVNCRPTDFSQNYEQRLQMAAFEYLFNEQVKRSDKVERLSQTGSLPCFCDA